MKILSFFNDLTLAKKILLALTPIFSMIIDLQSALLGLFILINLDLLTGIRKTLHQRGVKFNPLKATFWKSIKSYLLRQTWRKSYEYGIGILVVITFEALVFGQTDIEIANKIFTLTELAVVFPSAVETWSIFENLEAVSGQNILKKMLSFFPKKLTKLFKQVQ